MESWAREGEKTGDRGLEKTLYVGILISKVEQEKERELEKEIQEVHCTYVGILIGKVE